MNRSTRTAIVAAILIAPFMMAIPRPPQASVPTFEVASIKPYKDNGPVGAVMVGGNCRGMDSPTPGGPGAPQAMTVTVGGPPPGGGPPGGGPPPGAGPG